MTPECLGLPNKLFCPFPLAIDIDIKLNAVRIGAELEPFDADARVRVQLSASRRTALGAFVKVVHLI